MSGVVKNPNKATWIACYTTAFKNASVTGLLAPEFAGGNPASTFGVRNPNSIYVIDSINYYNNSLSVTAQSNNSVVIGTDAAPYFAHAVLVVNGQKSAATFTFPAGLPIKTYTAAAAGLFTTDGTATLPTTIPVVLYNACADVTNNATVTVVVSGHLESLSERSN
jgi:hypothetical protein